MEVKRGDLIAIALQGDYGKPRPVLVMQDNASAPLASVSVLRLTGELQDWPLFRITIEPDASNGLQKTSQVMIDKPAAIPKTKIGQRIGHLDEASMQAVSVAFGRFHGLSDGGK